MVVEIKCCVNSTNQHAQRPSPAPESSRPLKKYYLASRDFLRGKFLPRTLFRSCSCGGNTPSTGPKSLVPGQSSCGGNGALVNNAQFFSVTIYKVGKCVMPSVFKICSDLSHVMYSSLKR